ncbi:hypothetical protein PoB_001711900 [Plakobranchus ocellatus]|uniref:DUF19 domain-containing protein n=1 Tax=Plakobranchus ocellatus TaxID=259542 RepID=A0AAV3Z5M9_9GAST|nr:hypothetical protein PoB_001711900 [Plakobranchus ocellatus]
MIRKSKKATPLINCKPRVKHKRSMQPCHRVDTSIRFAPRAGLRWRKRESQHHHNHHHHRHCSQRLSLCLGRPYVHFSYCQAKSEMEFWTELLALSMLFFVCSPGTMRSAAQGNGLSRAKRSCHRLKLCLKPFPMLVDLIENDNAGALATLTYKSTLADVCSKQKSLEKCVSGKRCNRFEISYTAQAVLNSLKYICGRDKIALQTGSGCFSRDDFQSGVAQCTDIMKLDTKITTLAIQMGRAREIEFCSVFQNFLRCVHRKVNSVCSDFAADFVSTVFAYTIKDMSDNIGCSIKF